MELHPECVPCVMKRILFEVEMVDESKKREAIEEALKIFSEDFEEGAVSAEVATQVHGNVYDILETDDPYSRLKSKSNEAAEGLLSDARDIVDEKGFRGAVLGSIAGNVLDFGFREDIDSPQYLVDEFQNIVEEDLGWDDIEEIEDVLKRSDDVVFFTDNTGEIVFDTLLLKKIKDYDIHLTVVVKGEPILTDATMEDAERYSIDEIADELETTGGYAVGVDFDLISETLEKKLDETDLIIAKGMANWESFSETEYRPIAFITRSKCHPVADTMGVPFDTNVAKLFE